MTGIINIVATVTAYSDVRHYNKLTEKVIGYVSVATAAAMLAFAAWQGGK